MNDSTLFQGAVVFLIGNVDPKVRGIQFRRVTSLSYQCKVQSLIHSSRGRILCNIYFVANVLVVSFRFTISSKMEKHLFRTLWWTK